MNTRHSFLSALAILCVVSCGNNAPDTDTRIVRPNGVAATGSAEPHLFVSAEGTVILSWQEPAGEETALRFATLDGEQWTSPGTVATGDHWFLNWADFPSVIAGADSLWAAHWLANRAGGFLLLAHGGSRKTQAARQHQKHRDAR